MVAMALRAAGGDDHEVGETGLAGQIDGHRSPCRRRATLDEMQEVVARRGWPFGAMVRPSPARRSEPWSLAQRRTRRLLAAERR
jgi:hypothetical protein